MSKKVLITGATGDTGRAAVREAIALGLNVRAMVRKADERSAAIAAQGAEVVVGDLFDINSIRSALEGVDAAYFVYPVAPGLITAAVNFAQAAKEAGTKAVINLSQRSADRHSTSDSCRDTFIAEEVFNWSGVPVIHLRPTLFLEWLLYPFQLPYLQHGVLRLPAGNGRHSPIATDDQGRAIAVLLQNPEGHIGTTINLSGPVEMDHEQMAAELSDALGRKIVFQDLPIEEYTASLTEMGVPGYVVQHFGGAMLDYQNGHMAGADNNVEMLTGRRSMTVGEFAKLHADKLNAS
ncbi:MULTISPECIES: NmrA family NAD(P)-binding protein [Burkholderia]|uniref:NmrA family NAD(P)-binding protein n=1 Tax=Burkholderia TaxID=32008 RepID=UPI00065000F8|nr:MULTISPECIES: NmrA family NAD(P)-binding protein [Burkholderia]KML16212.1 NmrA family transcriptional regulator [Burkholderia cepacia]KML37010.1 NmrA family transcriptional regulator [Burkholderia lata]KMN60970.1 NmrA family transcriptional regulator [Burkholderia sp. LK4]